MRLFALAMIACLLISAFPFGAAQAADNSSADEPAATTTGTAAPLNNAAPPPVNMATQPSAGASTLPSPGKTPPGPAQPNAMINAASPIANTSAAYTLGSGDQVRVVVFGQPDLSGDFAVSGSGNVALPLVGDIPAIGLTASQFSKALEDKLRGDYLRDPHVSVQVLTFRPYYIMGEVNKPGEYPYSDGLTIMNAIATAGGYTYRANTKRVFIRRAGSGTEERTSLGPTTQILPGDTVRVPERYF